jgi:glycogen debranching enzyme
MMSAADSQVANLQHGAAGLKTRVTPKFFVSSAASLQERRPLTLKHAETFGLFDHNGDALSGPGSPEGIFHCDTRHLSHVYLTMDGEHPLLLSSTVRHDNSVLICDLTNPDLRGPDGEIVLKQDLLHIRRTRFLWDARALERLALHNFDGIARTVRLRIEFASDFLDIFEVRGASRPARGRLHPPEVGGDRVALAYTGLDGVRRETLLRFQPAPDEITARDATFAVSLEPGERRRLYLEISCNRGASEGPLQRAFFSRFREARRARRHSVGRAASIDTSNDVFNEAARRAVSDLYTLVTNTPDGPYPYAGIPWFNTVFGRDALITALQTLWLDPEIARGVLTILAREQAQEEDAAADAEPGKILHEVRQGEMAELGEVPFRRYYGSVDATPLFVMLAGAYLERTGDIVTIRAIWPNVLAALRWLEVYGDRDGDGFVEYGRRTAGGLVNQGWKDSHDSISHADGTLADGPVAVVEVQAYAYAAWQAGAAMAGALAHDEASIVAMLGRAETLREAFDAAFFDEELGTYVLALDGDKRPCRVRSSNAGHALLTGIARPERAEAVVRDLMQPSMFSGWGIRTLAATAARYNPMSYHNGSVWPHDTALVAAGMARYGYRAEAARLFAGLFDASTFIELRRLPELFCGFPRRRSHGPTFYPVACSPQAWAAGAMLSMLQSCLGLSFDADGGYVIFDEPALPDFLDSVTLRQLRLPQGSLDVTLSRVKVEVAAHVISRTGHARALVRS